MVAKPAAKDNFSGVATGIHSACGHIKIISDVNDLVYISLINKAYLRSLGRILLRESTLLKKLNLSFIKIQY
jgi:hypothetical protein